MEQWPHIYDALSGSNAISTSCGYSKFSACRNQHLEMQQPPISRPDPAPKRLIMQRKSHGEADTRGITGPEIAERQARAGRRGCGGATAGQVSLLRRESTDQLS
jgi:hypothetical protein